MLLVLTFSSPEMQDKFEYLFHRYKNLMLHTANRILHDGMLAEDAASEAFFRVYKNLHKIDDPDSRKTVSFLVTIVKNVSLTMLDRERRRDTDDLDETRRDSFELEDYVLSEMSVQAVYRAVDALSEELRCVFLLKYAHDLSHKEIGTALSISENNVTVRLHRARKKLFEMLREEGYAGEQE